LGYAEISDRRVTAICRKRELLDPVAEVRGSAAYAFRGIGPAAREAVPALITALKYPDARVRSSAAYAFRGIGPAAKEAVPALIEALMDPVAGVRRSIKEALAKIESAPRRP
jgi:HEAT repeat protein